ncbi:metallophosphoesterase [Streptomyces sp. NBC_00988]|uniref:metallophosphoesterase n=1 Tax=Streptomyces sp. NBC_00988 TaxID=2903704 RepID=UPI003870DE6C|nr:metallophosphoesterase [Streptomyces sp. NBC_00988]
MGELLAVSDSHVHFKENGRIVEGLRPKSDEDWLLVADGIGDRSDDVLWGLELFGKNFSKVFWVPGNHELWTRPDDPINLRGEARHRYLVDNCRSVRIVTPEDPFVTWEGTAGPVMIAPNFLLYDYSFRASSLAKEMALEVAERAGIVCTDEYVLHPDPYPSREAWCRARLEYTAARLDDVPQDMQTVLINHYPLIREPTEILRCPEFALWCGTTATEDWPSRYRAAAVVYGHLHIPRSISKDGIPHHEVSLGYPREWMPRAAPPRKLVRVLTGPPAVGCDA